MQITFCTSQLWQKVPIAKKRFFININFQSKNSYGIVTIATINLNDCNIFFVNFSRFLLFGKLLRFLSSLNQEIYVYMYTSWNYLLLNMAVWWGYISRRERGRSVDGEGTLVSNFFLISHLWYDVEKLTVPSSSNLALSFIRAQQTILR